MGGGLIREGTYFIFSLKGGGAHLRGGLNREITVSVKGKYLSAEVIRIFIFIYNVTSSMTCTIPIFI